MPRTKYPNPNSKENKRKWGKLGSQVAAAKKALLDDEDRKATKIFLDYNGKAACLTPMQQAFANEYIVDFNGKQAAVRAGYSPKAANVKASQLLKHPMVVKAVREALLCRSARTNITQDRVLREFSRVGFLDPVNFYDEHGELRPLEDLSEDERVCIKSMKKYYEYDSKGEVKGYVREIVFHDKIRALEKLAKHVGLLDEKIHIEDNRNVRVDLNVGLSQLSMNDLRALMGMVDKMQGNRLSLPEEKVIECVPISIEEMQND